MRKCCDRPEKGYLLGLFKGERCAHYLPEHRLQGFSGEGATVALGKALEYLLFPLRHIELALILGLGAADVDYELGPAVQELEYLVVDGVYAVPQLVYFFAIFVH